MKHLKKNIIIFLSVLTLCVPLIGVLYAFNIQASGEDIVDSAIDQLGKKYRAGSSDSKNGFDCSGFVYYIYNQNGYSIPRTSYGQYNRGKKIKLREAKPGDLVFFRIKKKRISHVGIYMGNGHFIHAPTPGHVIEITSIDTPYWQQHFAGAVTYLNDQNIIKKQSDIKMHQSADKSLFHKQLKR